MFRALCTNPALVRFSRSETPPLLVCVLWFSSHLANNRLFSVFVSFCHLFCSSKMCPFNPQRRSQEIIKHIINHVPLSVARTAVNQVFPQEQEEVGVFLKQWRCHQLIAVTVCYINSVRCHTRLPLILQTKHTLPLGFLFPSVPNFDEILFPPVCTGYTQLTTWSLVAVQQLLWQKSSTPTSTTLPQRVFSSDESHSCNTLLSFCLFSRPALL